jgi:Uma2 family endonuclease
LRVPPGRHLHAYTKTEAGYAQRQAVKAAGLDCRVLIDGVAVVIDEDTTFQPDILVECGPMPDGDSLVSTQLVIVVEVLSPGTRHIDKIAKLHAYASVQSIRHYLIIDPDKRIVVHQRRIGETRFDTARLRSGRLLLDPPGIEVAVEQLLAG